MCTYLLIVPLLPFAKTPILCYKTLAIGKEHKPTNFTFMIPTDLMTGIPVLYLKRDNEENDLSFMRYKDTQGKEVTITNAELLKQYHEYKKKLSTQPKTTSRRWYMRLHPDTRSRLYFREQKENPSRFYIKARPQTRLYWRTSKKAA